MDLLKACVSNICCPNTLWLPSINLKLNTCFHSSVSFFPMFQKLVINFKIPFNLHLFLFFNWHHIVTFLWSQKFVFFKMLTKYYQFNCREINIYNANTVLKHRVQYQSNEYLIKFWNAQLFENIENSLFILFRIPWKLKKYETKSSSFDRKVDQWSPWVMNSPRPNSGNGVMKGSNAWW